MLDQLFPSNPARAESLKKWAQLGWVIPIFDELTDESVVWHRPEQLEDLLTGIGLNLENLFASRSDTLSPEWQAPPAVAEDVIEEWWRIEAGLRKLESWLSQDLGSKPAAEAGIEQKDEPRSSLISGTSEKTSADDMDPAAHAQTKDQQVAGDVTTPEIPPEIGVKRKQKPRSSRNVVQIKSCGNAGIGIDVDGLRFYLFEECPDDGDLVDVSEAAVDFTKREGHFPSIMSHLAISDEGCLISITYILDIITRGSISSGKIKGSHALNEQGMRIQSGEGKIRSTMAGLAREMRKIANDSRNGEIFSKTVTDYRSAFRARSLSVDDKGRI